MQPLQPLRTAATLREAVAGLKAAGKKIALVPTMGALHEGHLTLMREARKHGDAVMATIFVNPTQFSPNEDLSRYPRDEAGDLVALTSAGVDYVYCPGVEEIYPNGPEATLKAGGPALQDLEDKYRPGHFDGVVTVVHTLFKQCEPTAALFGEKDYQQLLTIRHMAYQHNLPVEIIGVPVVREKDGLAMSSRNVYLTAEERKIAPTLFDAMIACANAAGNGEPLSHALGEARRKILDAGFVLQYLEARNARSLAPLEKPGETPARLLIAAKLGVTRLIDNISL